MKSISTYVIFIITFIIHFSITFFIGIIGALGMRDAGWELVILRILTFPLLSLFIDRVDTTSGSNVSVYIFLANTALWAGIITFIIKKFLLKKIMV